MLTFINSIEPEAWAGLAGLAIGVIGAVVGAVKGLKRTPPEVGTPKPEPTMVGYVLEEVRALNRRVGQIEESLFEIRIDLKLLLDRREK